MAAPTSQALQPQLNAVLAAMPAEAAPIVNQHIRALVTSGIEAHTLKAGSLAPDFTLLDTLGNTVSLTALLERGPVILTFYRGAWCPFCNLQLRAYQTILPEICNLGATLIAVSPQTPDNSLSMVEKQHLQYTVLSDVGNETARHYRLLFQLDASLRPFFSSIGADLPTANGDDSWELPMPGTFIIDADGIIRFAFVRADFTQRLEPLALLDALRDIL